MLLTILDYNKVIYYKSKAEHNENGERKEKNLRLPSGSWLLVARQMVT